MRIDGYYWVKYHGEWHIAHFRKGVNDPDAWSFAAYIDDSWWFYDSDFDEIDERRIERQEQYGPSPITVIKRAFDAGMSAATYNGHPGMPDAPQFEEWYSKWHKDVKR